MSDVLARASDLPPAVGLDEKADEALKRRLFRLKTLYDSAFELSRLITPTEIMEAFVLTAMGALGVVKGFVVLVDRENQTGMVASRGLDPDEAARLTDSLPQIGRTYFSGPGSGDPARLMRPHVFRAGLGRGDSPFPAQTAVVVKWVIDTDHRGMVGLGPKLDGSPFGDDDESFVSNLTANLLQALSRSLFTERLGDLRHDLEEKNAALAASLAEARAAKQALDRRVFYLKTLGEAVADVGGLLDPEILLERFLLNGMGATGAATGYVLLFRGQGRLSRVRGDPGLSASLEEVDMKSVYRLIARNLFQGTAGADAARTGHDREGRAEGGSGHRQGRIIDPAALSAAGLPGHMPAFWFVVDENAFGVMGLGRLMDAEADPGLQAELLAAMTGAFTSALGAAILHDRAVRLNADLTARNAELTSALETVTRCRVVIDGLEKARERIKDLVASEMERVSRARPLDFILIFVISAVVGLLSNMANPSGVELMPPWMFEPATAALSPVEARARLNAGQAVLIDARPREFYEKSRIPGAISVPAPLFDFVYGMRLSKSPPETGFIVYGRNVSRHYDEDVAKRLRERGRTAVTILSGGLSGWREAGLPVEERP